MSLGCLWLEELNKVKDVKDIFKCFATLHANIATEFFQFHEKLKETSDRIVELEKVVLHFKNEQLETKKSTIPGIIEEAEKNNKATCDYILALNLWGRKWNLFIHGITGEISWRNFWSYKEKVHKFFNTTLKIDPSEVKNIDIAAWHRIGGSCYATKELIIVTFVDLQQWNCILNLAKKFPKGSGYGVMVDLPPELSKLRGCLLKKKRELPFQQQKEAKFKYLQKAPFLQHRFSRWKEKERCLSLASAKKLDMYCLQEAHNLSKVGKREQARWKSNPSISIFCCFLVQSTSRLGVWNQLLYVAEEGFVFWQ